MAPIPRTWGSAFLERVLGWVNGLPSESCSYTFEHVDIPVADGINIGAYLYMPVGMKPVGTLLVRGPYGFHGFGGFIILAQAKIYATRGYQVLFTSCRGSYESGGEFSPGHNEVEDGLATVAWMRSQPWYTGSFATIGSSYMAYVQWALLSDQPPDMKAAAIYTGMHDIGEFAWGTGAFRSDIIAWAEMIPRSGVLSFLSIVRWLGAQPARLQPVFDSLPLVDGIEKHFGEQTPPWLRQMITTPNLSEASWRLAQQSEALERANIPIFLVSGWYDIFLEPAVEQYEKLVARGCKVALTLGPWQHLGTSDPRVVKDTFDMFDTHLAGRDVESATKSPVRVFVTGAREWRDLQVWPPPSVPHNFFLSAGKKLFKDLPPPDVADSTFIFDPSNPTPSVGMSILFDTTAITEDTALASRADVVTFTTEPLEEDLEIFGRPWIEICHSSDNPHADLFARLSDVNEKGISHTITEQYARLDPNRGQDPVHLTLRDCAHKFKKGSRVRLLLAGGCHPRFIRNLGTGEDPATGSTLRTAQHTISHKASAVSKIVLPVTTVFN
jgi:uncharacterized protein